MNITEKLIGAGLPARPGIKLRKLTGITVHETGNTAPGANAKNHMLYQTVNGGQNAQVSYHYVVDDKEAYRLIPENEVAWHAGDGATGPGNNETIAIEMCINSDGDMIKTIQNTFALIADICSRHGALPLFQHHYWSGKNCPANIRAGKPMNWDTFVAKANGTQAPQQPSKPTTDLNAVAREVINGVYGNGEARKANLKAKGYTDAQIAQIQAIVNDLLGASKPSVPSIDIEAIARAVINGSYGNGDARKQALVSKYGADVASKVQARVNAILGASTPQAPTVNIDAIAQAVIRGDYGNGQARKNALVNKYSASVAAQVQARVNKLLS